MPVALPLNPRDLNMISRRNYLGAMLSSIALSPSLMAQGDPKQKKKLAIITTEWRFRSHAWHMGERFLGGYPVKGKWQEIQ